MHYPGMIARVAYEDPGSRPMDNLDIFLLKNIDPRTDPSWIHMDLARLGYRVYCVRNAVNPATGHPAPMFFAELLKGPHNTTISGKKNIANQNVYVEQYFHTPEVPRCAICHGHEHRVQDCVSFSTCTWCSGPHMTSHCTIGRIFPPNCKCGICHPRKHQEDHVNQPFVFGAQIERFRKVTVEKIISHESAEPARMGFRRFQRQSSEPPRIAIKEAQPEHAESPRFEFRKFQRRSSEPPRMAIKDEQIEHAEPRRMAIKDEQTENLEPPRMTIKEIEPEQAEPTRMPIEEAQPEHAEPLRMAIKDEQTENLEPPRMAIKEIQPEQAEPTRMPIKEIEPEQAEPTRMPIEEAQPEHAEPLRMAIKDEQTENLEPPRMAIKDEQTENLEPPRMAIKEIQPEQAEPAWIPFWKAHPEHKEPPRMAFKEIQPEHVEPICRPNREAHPEHVEPICRPNREVHPEHKEPICRPNREAHPEHEEPWMPIREFQPERPASVLSSSTDSGNCSMNIEVEISIPRLRANTEDEALEYNINTVLKQNLDHHLSMYYQWRHDILKNSMVT